MRYLRLDEQYNEACELGDQWYSVLKRDADFLLEYGFNLFLNQQVLKAAEVWHYALQIDGITLHMRDMLNHNLRLTKDFPHLQHSTQRYPTVNTTFPSRIILTITTCKRLDLFIQTVQSFINACTDLHLIDRWICIDDNSSERDRECMSRLFPFFEFVWKSPHEKGHAISMNMLHRIVLDSGAKYVLHMEDDFQFFVCDNYIQRSINIMENNQELGQCLFNRNYAETLLDYNIQGGEIKYTSSNNRYILHEYNANGSNCSYWPHFSLRPGVWRVDMLKRVGQFNEHASHFEMEFAYRYIELGYKTAFLDGIFCKHIGRLTSERHLMTKLNAYDLNGESQFVKESQKNTYYVVNMARRKDRMDTLVFPDSIKDHVQHFDAIDGNALKPSPILDLLFANNDYNMRAGIVGCALSHLKLCRMLLDSDCDNYFIMEDDIVFSDKFDSYFTSILKMMKHADLVYLGTHFRKNPVGETKIVRWKTSQESYNATFGSTMAYVISKAGARKLFSFIDIFGMPNAIDTVQQNAIDAVDLVVYCCVPGIVSSPLANGTDVDTDIQNNFKSLSGNNYDELETVHSECLLQALSNDPNWNSPITVPPHLNLDCVRSNSKLQLQNGMTLLFPFSKNTYEILDCV